MSKLYFFVLACCLYTAMSCGGKKTAAPTDKALNIIVLLDLSDRVMDNRQRERDKALLEVILREFDQQAKVHQYVHCRNRLQVLVLPQKNIIPHAEDFEKNMRLDFAKLPLREKSGYLKKNGAVFKAAVDSVYALAGLPRRSSDYAGSDTWQFFSQYLPHYLTADTNMLNKVIILTDGYLDFESLEHKKQEGCQYSYSSAIMQAARKLQDNWKTAFANGCGLMPVVFNQYNIQLMALELQPRNSFKHEAQLLLQLWSDWAAKMQIRSSKVNLQSALEDEGQMVADFLGK